MDVFTTIADKYGLAIAGFVMLIVALRARFFVLGSDADSRVSDLKASYAEALRLADAEKEYREARRLEERTNRLATEEALRKQLDVMKEQTELLKDIERSLLSRP
jgi:hypothetical protein